MTRTTTTLDLLGPPARRLDCCQLPACASDATLAPLAQEQLNKWIRGCPPAPARARPPLVVVAVVIVASLVVVLPSPFAFGSLPPFLPHSSV